MNLAIEISNFISDLTDRASGSVHVASYTGKDFVIYVLSDDQTCARLTVYHAKKKLTEEARVNIIAPNLVKKLTDDSQHQTSERSTERSMSESEEQR